MAILYSSSFGALPCQPALFSMKETPLPLVVLQMITVGCPFTVLASANAAASEWGAVIQVVNADVSTFRPGLKFDRIVCNPPYFRDSLRCPDAGRNTARHNDSLSFETLMECAALMLAPAGRLSVVIPADAVETLLKCAAVQGLGLSRRTDVVTVAGKTPKRSLVELYPYGGLDAGHEVLCMFGADGKATAEYAALVRDFYLKF